VVRLFLDFLFQCFQWNPKDRLNPSKAFHHPWIAEDSPRSPMSASIFDQPIRGRISYSERRYEDNSLYSQQPFHQTYQVPQPTQNFTPLGYEQSTTLPGIVSFPHLLRQSIGQPYQGMHAPAYNFRQDLIPQVYSSPMETLPSISSRGSSGFTQSFYANPLHEVPTVTSVVT